jgi:thioesterase domain-containing protein
VYIYRELASYLEVEQPVYGLQATSLEAVSKPVSIEEMATHYLEAIKVCQPTGPYCLGGSSFGGLVAFEMAQQLQTQGQTVALLAMIDTPHPSQVPTGLKEDVDILAYLLMVGDHHLETSLEQIRQLTPDEQLQYFLERGKIANKILPQTSSTQQRAFLHLFKTNVETMLQYVPRPYGGRIIFFRAQEQDAFNPAHPERHWLDLVTGGVELHEIPGNHITMNYSPQVEVIAKRLQKYLQLVS